MYDNVIEILKSFFNVRPETYDERKVYLEGMLKAEASKLSNQARFILEICDGTIVIGGNNEKDIIAELIRRKFESDPVYAWKMVAGQRRSFGKYRIFVFTQYA